MTDTELPGENEAPRAPAMVERLVKLLNIAFKAVKLYPGASEIPRETAGAAIAALRELLGQEPIVRFTITREGLFYDGHYSLPATPAFASFARELYARNLSEVRFHAGCSGTDIIRFLTVATASPEELMERGGFEAEMWEADVTAITVVESARRIVDESALVEESTQGETAGPSEPWPPSLERMQEIVAGAAAGLHTEERLLVRVLGDSTLVETYLGVGGEGTRLPSDALLGARVEAMAKGLGNEMLPDRDALLRSLAEAVLDLEPEVRQRLVAKRMLTDAKRGSDAVASVLREMTLTEAMDSILFGMEETPEARAGVARAIRYLSLIGVSAPEGSSVLKEAAGAMKARGASEGFIRSVLDRAAPRRVDIHPRAHRSTADPVDSVLKLVDLTPDRGGPHAYDESVAPLREEAARGLTDGDVVAALVSVAALETRPEYAETLAVLVEDRIAYLLDQHEFEVAADAAATLTAAEQDPKMPAAQRKRMREMLLLLSKPDAMRKVTTAMRVFRHDSAEYGACKRLLGVLGNYTVMSLLEVLAEEQDMTGRKAIVELISSMADRFVPELGSCVNDKRWYFVRNVVAILGSIRDSRVLPHLGRTLRHSDERVRRETIRAIAGIRDALATEMLVAALADDSAQNVQLAARYLGSAGGQGVLPALEQVARGEGRGNRDTGPRIEAIEALGRIGGESSLRVLSDIARQRGLIAGRTKEVRTAAEAAIAALDSRGMAGGGAS